MDELPGSKGLQDCGRDRFIARQTQLVLKSILIRLMGSMQPVMITQRRTVTILTRKGYFSEYPSLFVLQYRNPWELKEIRLGLLRAFVLMPVVVTGENRLLLAIRLHQIIMNKGGV